MPLPWARSRTSSLPVFDNGAYEALLANRRSYDRSILGLTGGLYEAQLGALGGEANLLSARRRATGARLGTIGAQAGVTQAQRGVNAASAAVLGAEQVQLAGTRGLIGLQQAQAGQRQADVSLIRSARDDVADKGAVAKAGQARGVEDERLYNRLGVSAPVDIDVPAGQEGALGLGTRASLRTKEEIVRGQVADREADRAATLENARLALSMSATNVTEAELMARRAGLTLADARLLVDEAQTREALAGVDVANAQLDTAEADLGLRRLGIGLDIAQLGRKSLDLDLNDMKAPGDEGYELYRDPYTRELSWKTPAEADQLQFEYETSLTRQRLPVSVSLAQERQTATQRAQAEANPFYYFDDSDFITYLATGVQDADSSEPSFKVITAQIYQALLTRYGDPRTADIKLSQYVNEARVLQAKRRDERGGLERP